MAVGVQTDSLERDWLLRAVLVLQRPTMVFRALRDDSDDAAAARQEPVLALILLAGAASVLASPVARTLLDDPARDGLVVAVWAFLGGAVYGIAGYWLLGLLVHAFLRGLGGRGSYRGARHLVAFASAPLALSLVTVWPLALAAFGGDLFRSGGTDERVVAAATLAFAAWSVALLVVGVRTVHAWTWARALAASALAVAAPAALILLTSL
jgi:hypothetical protein